MNVLLTDGQQPKTLAAVRSLGKKGLQLLVAEDTRWALGRYSRYCSQGLVYPSPRLQPEAFYHWLLTTLQRYRCEVLLPMDDSTLDVVIQHREELEQLCRIPLPATGSYQVAADKALAVKAASEAGLDCPATVFPSGPADLPGIVEKLVYPLVIKPRHSSGSRGIVVVRSQADLLSQYLLVHQRYPNPIIQEYVVPGAKFDVCVLFNSKAQLKAAFVHRQVRNYPLERGPSTVQESVLRPDLVEMATSLLQRLNWYGVADVEMIEDQRNGKVMFMEINPRFWSSVQMAILAGVDFPWLLYRMAMDGDVQEVLDYSTGLTCRWLLPGDMLHFLANKNRWSMNPPFWSGRRSGVNDNILSLEDPLPVLGFGLACCRYLLDREMWRFFFRR